MLVVTLLIIAGTLLPDAPALDACRAVVTPAGYDFARVHVGECVTVTAPDGTEAQYLITEIRIQQALSREDWLGEFAFDALEQDTESGAMLYKLIERHALIPTPPRMRYGGV